MRWRLLVLAARLCGLKVGAVTQRGSDLYPAIVLFTREDTDTIEALESIADVVAQMRTHTKPRGDGPRREWVN